MRKNLDGGLLHAMHAFLKVIDSGSFTAAAEQMELTTAQVSRLISELEGRLGTKLLQRSTRQHALTDIGATYAEQCRQVLAMVEEAEAQAMGMATKPLVIIMCLRCWPSSVKPIQSLRLNTVLRRMYQTF